MIRKNTKISKLIGTLILSIFIVISSVNITFAVEKDEKTPGGSTGSSGQTVTIPPIIPPTDNPKTGYKEKIYIPINVSGESNKTYLQNRLLPSIANVIISITGGLSLLFAIVSGIQMLTAYGNSDQATAARKTLTFALVGLVISALSYGIVAIIASITV